MKYSVTGADKNTGDERTVIISASDEKDAERQAREMGLLVSAVFRRGDLEGKPPKPASIKLPNIVAAAATGGVPYYGALKAIGFVFKVNAAVGYLGGAVAFCIGIYVMATAAAKGDHEAVMIGVEIVLWGLAAAGEAVISQGIGECFGAFRDLVRNSFRI